MESLYAQGYVARAQYDQSQADRATAQAAVVQAQAAVAQAAGNSVQSSGAVAVAAVPLSNVTIRAPFAGVITAKAIDAGAVVSPGAATYTLQDDRNLEVDLAVPEDVAATLSPGSGVRVHVDALNRDVAARIRAIVPATGADLHTTTVKVALTTTPGMFSGMYARVTLERRPRIATAVPWSAVVTRAGQPGVFEIGDGHARFVPVESGATQNGFIEVRGVAAGREIAVTGLERLNDGTAVTLQ
jgi:RND family efflux transporter MFP subunit